jgi:hypothetical protein
MRSDDEFYSVNRLVEFGLGLTVADQMVKSMNSVMKNAFIPGSGNVMQKPVSMLYYAVFAGNRAGPFSETEIIRFIEQKKITRDTLIWYPGMTEWKKAAEIPDIMRLLALTPPVVPIS